jgi:hypothetical protein
MHQAGHSDLSATSHYLRRLGGDINMKIKENFTNPY